MIRRYLSPNSTPETANFVAYQAFRWLRRKRNQLFRYGTSSIGKKSKQEVHHFFRSKTELAGVLHQRFGNTAGYETTFQNKPFRDQIIQAAEAFVRHEFDLLGSGKIILQPINWHADFKSGFEWKPGTFYLDYKQVDLSNDADVKVPRELSRSHHLLILGQAYLLTGDERYTDVFISHIQNWIGSNPLMRSINWGCTMDVAIRAVNWIYALNLFVRSPHMSDDFLKTILESLYQHGYYIYRNPENSYPANGNHYIADMIGLLFLGLLFEGLEEPHKWKVAASLELQNEIRTQILPSGVQTERSLNYNRLVVELFMWAYALMLKNGMRMTSDVGYRLEKACEFIRHYLKPDGLAPVVGDQDDAFLLPFEFGIRNNRDHHYLLAMGAILFNRPDLLPAHRYLFPEIFFLFGEEKTRSLQKLEISNVNLKSGAFPDGGFYIQRERDHYLFINLSGPKGYHREFDGKTFRKNKLPVGTHTHSDLLSFELCVGQRTFLVDPGSYVYTSSAVDRNHFRSTAMHNTVTVDGENQNTLSNKELFRFETYAHPTLLQWNSNENRDIFEGMHDGFTRLKEPVTHRRRITFEKQQKHWLIEDHLGGTGNHLFEWFFHFDAGIPLKIIDQTTVLTAFNKEPNICLKFTSGHPFSIAEESSWVSKAYGEREPAQMIRIRMEGACPQHLLTSITLIG